ncbi:TRAP transporter substrate-binding protein [Desertibaculum subflavum]|uniref:TRAP transporter substrate-binding protein n=1 Tax=Desertibaculum subflavum TaxID=2268458 RepID=UPI0034D2446E
MKQQSIKRRQFLKKATIGAAATAAASASFPKFAISQNRIEWRMVTAWPRGLPPVHQGAERIARRIETMSNGRMTVKVYSAGELLPAFGGWDGIISGACEMAHDTPYYHVGKCIGAAAYSAVPFGMNVNEMYAWLTHGGGYELWDKLYAPFGLKGFIQGPTGEQFFGWFRKEIKSVDDLKGLKMRTAGYGVKVLQKLGATVVTLPPGETFAALQSGAIDTVEWVGPYADLSLGFYKLAKYYYWPGTSEPSVSGQVMVSKPKYDALPKDLQEIIKVVCEWEYTQIYADYFAPSVTALSELVNKHGVQLRQVPRDVLLALGKASGEVMQEVMAEADPNSKAVLESYLKYRKSVLGYSRITELAYMQARMLDFPYPG